MTLLFRGLLRAAVAAGMEALEARKECRGRCGLGAAEEAAAAEAEACREGRRGVVHGLPRSGSRGRPRSGA